MLFKYYRNLKIEKQESVTGLLFILPYSIGFLLFQGLPFIISFIISTTNLRYISKLDQVRFVGISNFVEMFQDKSVVQALTTSLKYCVMYVPAIMLAALLLALMLNQKIYARNFLRTMLFMPYVSNIVAVSVIFSIMLSPTNGIINTMLRSFGVGDPPMWLLGTETALPTVAAVACWQQMGMQMVIYLAALQDVPKELVESASIDGANAWVKFTRVLLPTISPTTFFLTITTIIGSLKNFSIIQTMTGGGPGTSTTVLPVSIVRSAFGSYRLGYASAQGILLFAVVMVITAIQWRGQKKWVNYM